MLQSGHLLRQSCARGPLSREHESLLGTGGCLSLALLVLAACLYVLLHPGLLPVERQGIPRLPDLLWSSLFLNTRQPLQ